MLEPRRLAARAAAQRLAAGLGEAVGETVGYRVRLEQRVSERTRVEVVTVGVFLRRLQADPALEGVGCVIFDEFHERGAEADLALTLLREARAVLAPGLRLLVMSATLDIAPLAERFPEASVLRSDGRGFPVEVSHQLPRENETLARQVVRALEAHWLERREPGETALVFLPGQREIHEVLNAIRATPWSEAIELTPLHGTLPLEAQGRAIAVARHPAGKVVLATSIAESSLTIEGVRLVIDSGLCRRSRFDPGTGMDALVTMAASQAAAAQRQGRAGRTAPGRCVRLWSPAEHRHRPAFDRPEILESDPLPLVLQLAQWGAGLGERLPWLDPPPRPALLEGQELLRQLGGVDARGALTPHGRGMARLALHPRLAHMLLRSRSKEQRALAIELAVLLNERDPLSLQEAGSDLMRRLDWLPQSGHHPIRRQLRQLQEQLKRQLLEWTGSSGAEDAGSEPWGRGEARACREAEGAAELITWAYPDRIAMIRPGRSGHYLMRNGRGALLHPQDPLTGCEALAIARVDGGGADARILQALPLSRGFLERLQEREGHVREVVAWDPETRRVRAERRHELGALILERRPWPGAGDRQVTQALVEGLRQEGLSSLPWTTGSHQLRRRLQLMHTRVGSPWPRRSEQALLDTLPDWLGDQLHGRRSIEDLKDVDLMEALWCGLEWEHRRDLERLLPGGLTVPSGRWIALDYREDEVRLTVKLQEMFGCAITPTVLDGSVPVTLHLLSPAGRPVQITRDLQGFWSGSYSQVRTELRGRYPKHPWPEDPVSSTPTALTQRQQRLAQAQTGRH
jgi:ATP-dependent helicase HrpB